MRMKYKNKFEEKNDKKKRNRRDQIWGGLEDVSVEEKGLERVRTERKGWVGEWQRKGGKE